MSDSLSAPYPDIWPTLDEMQNLLPHMERMYNHVIEGNKKYKKGLSKLAELLDQEHEMLCVRYIRLGVAAQSLSHSLSLLNDLPPQERAAFIDACLPHARTHDLALYFALLEEIATLAYETLYHAFKMYLANVARKCCLADHIPLTYVKEAKSIFGTIIFETAIRFDPSKACRFITYLTYRARYRLQQFFKNDNPPAIFSNFTNERVPMTSLNRPLSDDGQDDTRLEEIYSDDNASVENELLKKITMQQVLSRMNSNVYSIFMQRYVHDTPMEEIAEQFQVSKESIYRYLRRWSRRYSDKP